MVTNFTDKDACGANNDLYDFLLFEPRPVNWSGYNLETAKFTSTYVPFFIEKIFYTKPRLIILRSRFPFEIIAHGVGKSSILVKAGNGSA